MLIAGYIVYAWLLMRIGWAYECISGLGSEGREFEERDDVIEMLSELSQSVSWFACRCSCCCCFSQVMTFAT